MSKKIINTDLCVIGAGSGGLSVAAGAVQMGADTVLIEGGKMGGDCLNYGCVPSKALIAAAKKASALDHAADFGVTGPRPTVDYGRSWIMSPALLRALPLMIPLNGSKSWV